METQLQSLIDKIKSDGVAEAEKQAQTIISDGEEQASKRIREAESRAEQIIEDAKQNAVRLEDAGKKALEQSGRSLVLGVEKSLTELFDRVLKEEITEALTPKVLAGILEKIIEKWDPDKGFMVELGESDEKELLKGLLGNLQKKAKKGLTLKPVKVIDAGFSIGEKDGSLFYDFTDWGMAEMLAQYLNPMLGEILKKGVR